MAKKSYATHVWTILGSSAALLLFIYILVAHHREIPDRVRLDRGALLADSSNVAARIKPVGELALAGAQAAPAQKPAAAPAPVARDGQQAYQAGCVACHDAGIAGAPKTGDKVQWAKRIAKGSGTLYASAINGVQGSAGVMPPKGGNLALSDAEVRAAVDYMVARSR